MSSLSRLSYGERASKHQHPVAKRLFETAEAKKSNLIVSADFTTTKDLLECADSKYQYLVHDYATVLTLSQTWVPTWRF